MSLKHKNTILKQTLLVGSLCNNQLSVEMQAFITEHADVQNTIMNEVVYMSKDFMIATQIKKGTSIMYLVLYFHAIILYFLY